MLNLFQDIITVSTENCTKQNKKSFRPIVYEACGTCMYQQALMG